MAEQINNDISIVEDKKSNVISLVVGVIIGGLLGLLVGVNFATEKAEEKNATETKAAYDAAYQAGVDATYDEMAYKASLLPQPDSAEIQRLRSTEMQGNVQTIEGGLITLSVNPTDPQYETFVLQVEILAETKIFTRVTADTVQDGSVGDITVGSNISVLADFQAEGQSEIIAVEIIVS